MIMRQTPGRDVFILARAPRLRAGSAGLAATARELRHGTEDTAFRNVHAAAVIAPLVSSLESLLYVLGTGLFVAGMALGLYGLADELWQARPSKPRARRGPASGSR